MSTPFLKKNLIFAHFVETAQKERISGGVFVDFAQLHTIMNHFRDFFEQNVNKPFAHDISLLKSCFYFKKR